MKFPLYPGFPPSHNEGTEGQMPATIGLSISLVTSVRESRLYGA